MSSVPESIRYTCETRPKTTLTVAVVLVLLLGLLTAHLTGSPAAPVTQNAVTTPIPAPETEPYAPWAEAGGIQLSENKIPQDGAAPARIRIPELGMDAPAHAVGLNNDGSAEVPHNPKNLGWYQPLGTPDQNGNDVVVGHVNYNGKRGAFHNLAESRTGNTIHVTYTDGTKRRYTIQTVNTYPKTKTPLQELYTPNGPEQLVLITCGGAYSTDLNHYESNVVVTATPA